MTNHFYTVCAVSPRLRVADPDYNATQICAAMTENTDAGILVFPELGITGYTCGDLFQQERLLERAQVALRSICLHSQSMYREGSAPLALVGMPLRVGHHLYNCAAAVSRGNVVAFIPQTHIPNYGSFCESRWFTSARDADTDHIRWMNAAGTLERVPFGTDILLFDEANGATVGVEVGEDGALPDSPGVRACQAGATFIAHLSASSETAGAAEKRRERIRQQSASTASTYIYANACGDESSTDLVFSGHELIAQNGKLLGDALYWMGGTLRAVVDEDRSRQDRRIRDIGSAEHAPYRRVAVAIPPLKAEASPWALAQALRQSGYPVSPYPFVPDEKAARRERCAEILRIQAHGLVTRMRATGLSTLVIGVSGGLDSTLALLVAHEACRWVPESHIIGVSMPMAQCTTEHTQSSALTLMERLGMECRVIDITDSVKVHLRDIGHADHYVGEGDVAFENAQARIRTLILMDIANTCRGLVVGTGDLSELALGWCTYNGDHMSMYGVNGGVPKTLIRHIVAYYADTCEDDGLSEVLQKVCATPISPELTPSVAGEIAQRTESILGNYDLNDFFLFHFVRYGACASKLLTLAMVAYPHLSPDHLRTAAEKFFQRFFSQQFKRNCLPDGPKVGSVSLSPRGDWHMPSDVRATAFLSELQGW